MAAHDDPRSPEKREFGGLLRELMKRAGATQQQIIARMPRRPAAQTVSDLLLGTGVRPPDLDLVLEFVRACAEFGRSARGSALSAADADPDRWRARHAELSIKLDVLAPPRRGSGRARVQSTLPSAAPVFVGRERELAALTGQRAGVVVIDGMPGSGKTSLAVHAAHRLAAEYPDGQLFVPLHAHSPVHEPRHPTEVLDGLLQHIGVDAREIPSDPAAMTALWQQRLAGSRLLLVLDDAAGHEQVRPLLPAADTCLVLVTSRRLLVALDDTTTVHLDMLGADEAGELFRALARTGPGHDAEIAELVRLAGHLPLAVRVLAGWLRHHPAWQAADLVELISTSTDRWSLVRAENVTVDAVFALSYDALPPTQRVFFRRLGLNPGTEIETHAAAALAGVGVPEARRELDALYQANLLDEARPGRYRMHDLLQDHARALAAGDPPAEQRAAVERLYDYYLATVEAAVALSEGDSADAPPTHPQLRTPTAARRWLEAELPNLAGSIEHAVEAAPGRGVELALALSRFLYLRGHWREARRIHGTALRGARGDRVATARLLVQLAVVRRLSGLRAEAEADLDAALDTARAEGELGIEADALVEHGWLHLTGGRHRAALDCLATAAARARALADPAREAAAAALAGIVHYEMDDVLAGEPQLSSALAVFERIGSTRGAADTLTFRGDLLQRHGQVQRAERDLTAAVELYDRLDCRHGRACALGALGAIRMGDGRADEAYEHLSHVLELHDEMGNRYGAAYAHAMLGRIETTRGRHPLAVEHLRTALDLHRAVGNENGAAEAAADLDRLLATAE